MESLGSWRFGKARNRNAKWGGGVEEGDDIERCAMAKRGGGRAGDEEGIGVFVGVRVDGISVGCSGGEIG